MSVDLTGCWYGRYAGTNYTEANRFIALLEESAGSVIGRISEPDDLGLAEVRHATVSGRRSGTAVSFVKQYDGGVLAHAVEYEGILNEDATVLRGGWSFGDYRGEFVMERELFTVEELEDDAEAEMDDALPALSSSPRT